MALVDVVTLPARLTVAALRTTLLLGELVAPEGPVRRVDGYADRLMLLIGRGGVVERLAELITMIPGLHASVTTLNQSVGPLGELANRIPGGRRRQALEA